MKKFVARFALLLFVFASFQSAEAGETKGSTGTMGGTHVGFTVSIDKKTGKPIVWWAAEKNNRIFCPKDEVVMIIDPVCSHDIKAGEVCSKMTYTIGCWKQPETTSSTK